VSGGSKSQTVGYRYYLGVHMALAHGPLDNINAIEVDRRNVYAAEFDGGLIGYGDQGIRLSIDIDKPQVFGGDSREGGISGRVSFDFGTPSQLPNSYLVDNLAAPVPAFRGVTCAVLEQCYMGNNPYLKPWSFTAKRITRTSYGDDIWNRDQSEIARIGSEDESCPSRYRCDGIDFFGSIYGLQLNDGAWWPMNDPDLSNVVPSQFNGVGDYTLKPGGGTAAGIGGPYEGDHQFWSPTLVSIDGFEECEGLDQDSNGNVYKRYKHSYDTITDYAYIEEFESVSETVEEFAVTAILAVDSPTTVQSFIVDLSSYYARTNRGNAEVNPRVTIFVNQTPGEITFTSSLNGPNQGVSIPYKTGTDVHVATVVFKEGAPERTAQGAEDRWRVSYDFTGYVDDATPESWTHKSADFSVEAGGTVWQTSTRWLRPFRGGSAQWLGLALAFNENPHTEFYFAARSNDPNFGGIAEGVECPGGSCPDMNPAHIVYECLTDTVWGMGYSENDIDEPSFLAAADTLLGESMGISILWERSQPLEDFIGEILRHIDAVLYVSRQTGKFVLKLIRQDDEDSNTLVLDESNILDVPSVTRPTISELTNTVSVVYWDPQKDDTTALNVHNEALRQVQGVEIGTTIQYPGFTNFVIAQRVALRDLKALSTPLISCTVRANRDAALLNIGDVFYLDWPDLNINNTLMRANTIDYGDGINNSITIECVQDVFATPETAGAAVAPESLWLDPNEQIPQKAVNSVVMEAPYHEVYRTLGNTETAAILSNNPGAGYLYISAGREFNEFASDAYIDSGTGYSFAFTSDFHPWAIVEPIGITDDELVIIESKDLIGNVDVFDLILVDDEWMQVGFVQLDSNENIASIFVSRGVFDTVPVAHLGDSDGVVVKFVESYAASDDIEYSASESVNVKLRTTIGSSILDEDDAPTNTVVFDSRAIRPYPAGNLKVDGLSYPESYTWTGDHFLTWEGRDRIVQADVGFGHFQSGGVGEDGTTYRIEGYAYVGDSTVEEQFLYTDVGDALSWGFDSNVSEVDSNMGFPPEDSRRIVLRVVAQRDGYDSWQSPEVEFQVPPFTDSVGDSNN
jgi:hypothetical protein